MGSKMFCLSLLMKRFPHIYHILMWLHIVLHLMTLFSALGLVVRAFERVFLYGILKNKPVIQLSMCIKRVKLVTEHTCTTQLKWCGHPHIHNHMWRRKACIYGLQRSMLKEKTVFPRLLATTLESHNILKCLVALTFPMTGTKGQLMKSQDLCRG